MFYLKKQMMKKIIDKRKSKNPFDYEKAENYSLQYNGDNTINNSYYFSAHSYEKAESLYVRLGLRADKSAEVWAFYNKGSENYVLKQIFYTIENSPLQVTHKDNIWGFIFEGTLTNDTGKNCVAKFDCVFTSSLKAIDFFYNMPSSRTATAMAQDKWTKEFFSEVQKNNQVHYEQEGNLSGKVTIDNKDYSIDLPCIRDHSYGKRVWSYMNNHIWLFGISNTNQLNFSMVSYPSLSILEMGSLHKKDENVKFVSKAHYDRNKVCTGEIPNELEMEFFINKNEKVKTTIKLIHSDTYLFDNGKYALTEGIAEYIYQGETLRGIFEIGFNNNHKRIMNGRNIGRIKE